MQDIYTSHDTRFSTPSSVDVDIYRLENDLRAVVSGEVNFDDGAKGLYATDASNYRQIPLGIVVPKHEEDIINAVKICHKYKAPVLTRGGGTSLAGQCCNVAVVIDVSKYFNKILDFNPEKKLIKVQTGLVLDELNRYIKDSDLIFGPDPATHTHCTIGGMIGNNSCGVHSVMAEFAGNGARMEDNVESLTILTYDGHKMEVGPVSGEELKTIIQKGGRKGEIFRKLKALSEEHEDEIRERFPDIPRRVSGYNLPELLPENNFNIARALVGTEGSCVVVLDATLKLINKPKAASLVVLGYKDIYEAGNNVPKVLEFEPVGLEGMDYRLVEFMKKKDLHPQHLSLLPEGDGWLIAEFGAEDQDKANKKANELIEALKKDDNPPSIRLYDNEKKQEAIWDIRESGLGATAWVPGEVESVPGWEDSAVAPGRVGEYLRDLNQLFTDYGYHPALYGHFGQGCIHCRVGFDLFTAEGLEKYQDFTIKATELVKRYGGSISGEHGDGQARADLLEIMYGENIVRAFREFKAIWDPDWKMNPGKVVQPYGLTTNLRWGTNYNPDKTKTYFQFPDDENDFRRSTLRCVGVGKCRRSEGGTMCPSFMVTHEEKHSTRGRARLLHEMVVGDVVKNKWKNESVKEALDLCLSCKGCKGDCPVDVDVATYKAEFLAHYYKGRIRPRAAFAFGLIYWWARLGSLMPGVVNWLSRAPVIKTIIKKMGDIASERELPKFAPNTFRQWYKRNNNGQAKNKSKVILWADTFNNFFKPETLIAGKEVLERAGYQVVIPEKILCCGRPLYDWGMLKQARRMLRVIISSLQADIRSGTPVVGLEPSCVAVFRDELTNFFPHDKDAARLKEQTFTLAEFLLKEDVDLPEYHKKALIHRHCHHQAIMKFDSDEEVLKKLGLKYQILDSGCCGMAGAFGYEEGARYEISIKAGERYLLPHVRKADRETIIMTDGFSCREQIEQCTDRSAKHLAEVLLEAMERGKME
ncbi:lactate dehydrogenase like protein [Fulvivirga imtechensis AK7]|uniref:Lactate dehydrogenase like protein n=1 Tax=Fulvivirga imtechensis AK7 TaxID=1237149 RepID=L8JY69_9BACT|nr:FAD-binding and (Fe-S)-binding domain-containing protein [Fulvivirga imtechensis]ELR73118.1 lactate dehydrogenase like protein [Fulvivirga imtechensis AK7]